MKEGNTNISIELKEKKKKKNPWKEYVTLRGTNETRSAYTEISRGWFDIGYTTFHVSDSRGGTRERLSLDENRAEGMVAAVVGRRGGMEQVLNANRVQTELPCLLATFQEVLRNPKGLNKVNSSYGCLEKRKRKKEMLLLNWIYIYIGLLSA